jgi:pimeloyl-ACP methyl ester carboxylesterase
MARHPGVNPRRLGILGHSEGGLLGLKIAEARPQQVTALFNFGVQSRSMGEVLRFQYIERHARLLAIADANFDGALDLNEMRAFAERTSPSLFEVFRLADVDRDARLTEGEWRFYWSNELQVFLRQVWDETLPWSGNVPRAWFRQYLQEGAYFDRQTVFCDRTTVFHGELDDQTPYDDALSLKAICDLRRQPLRVYSYGSLGHGFSSRRGFRFWQNTLAPIDPRVATDLSREAAQRLLR